MTAIKNPTEYWIIDTKTLSNRYTGIDFEMEDPARNPEYAEMLKEEKARTLHLRNPHMAKSAASRAANLHEDWMLTEECKLYKTEYDGLIFFDDKEACAKQLKKFQERDRDIRIHPMGRQLDEEETSAKKSKK